MSLIVLFLVTTDEGSSPKRIVIQALEGGDRGSLWYRYQLIRYQVPPKLKVLVPLILGEGAIKIVQLIMNMTNSER